MHNPPAPHKEPEEVFLPLSLSRYAEFYSLEMDNFSSDIDFYRTHISDTSNVLELGCGTGRICRNLSQSGYDVTGIDLSPEMLQLAAKQDVNSSRYICMDMCQMAFCHQFDHIIIPYNTLNLLQTESQILKCLKQVYDFLKPGGTLLFQVHLPKPGLPIKQSEKVFQFQLFSLSENRGKLIKESIRSYFPEKEILLLEERYRVRPLSQTDKKEDFRHLFQLAGFPFHKWIDLINQAQLNVLSLFGDYNGSTFHQDNDSTLLIIVRKQI